MPNVGIMASAYNVPVATCTDVLSEPFNDFTTNGWNLGGSGSSIVAGRTGTAMTASGSSHLADYLISAPFRSDTITIGFAWLKTDASTAARVLFQTYSDIGGANTLHNGLLYNPATTTLYFTRTPSNTVIASNAAVTLAQNTWYYIETQCKLHDTAGYVKVSVNGVEVINTSSLDTKNAGTSTVYEQIRLTTGLGAGGGKWDDLYLSTGPGCAFKGDPNPPYVFMDTCDNFTYGSWLVTGAPVVTASGYSGNGFSIPASASNAIDFFVPSAKETEYLTIGFRINFSAISGVARTFIDWRSDSNVTSHANVRIWNPSGTLQFYRTSPASGLGSPGAHGIANGTWYSIEASLRLSDTVGFGIVKVNGVTISTTNATDDTKSSGTKTTIDTVRIVGGTGMAFIIDNIYIRNDNVLQGVV